MCDVTVMKESGISVHMCCVDYDGLSEAKLNTAGVLSEPTRCNGESKLRSRQYPAIHTNFMYMLKHCTTLQYICII